MKRRRPPRKTVLSLAPPIVNGRTEPVEGAMIGLPIVAYDLVTDGEGAIVFADPPLSGTMDPKDVMELWLEAESAVLDSETIVDPDKRTTLRIPRGRLHPDRINNLYYTVRRGSDNVGTSLTLSIHYNRIRPGLKDRYDAPGGHSELELLLPDVIKNGVGPDFVSAQVCVEYPYCRAHDVITLKCNGEFLEPKPTVLPAQAPLFPGSEAPIKICFTVTRAFLDKAKRQDNKLHFSYTVTDQIGNGPDTDAPWSPVQSVDEDLDGVLLPMPILLERKEDYPGDDASIIDLEKLAGNPLLLVVLTQDNRFAVGDEIVATYTTTGQTDPVVVRGEVEEDPFLGKLPCFLEVPNDKVFAGSKVTASYELRRPNVGLVGSSNTATATVTDTVPIDLQPEITSVTDSLSKEIPHNGGTVDPQVKLTGTATPLQRVEIFEGADTKGDRAVNARGIWTYDATLTGTGTRTFTAKAKYGTGQVSAGRTFTLSNALTPTIDSVKDSTDVEIPDNGFTSDTTIKLNGTATPRLEVEIFDGAVPIGKATADPATGKWERLVSGLSVAAHSFTAKALYGTGLPSSAARTIRVVARLNINASQMNINGFSVKIPNWPKTGQDSIGNTDSRQPQGGVPPYNYRSNNIAIASVTPQGKVTGNSNGDATIFVTDQIENEVSFNVRVTNTHRLVINTTLMSAAAARSWVLAVNGTFISNGDSEILTIFETDINRVYIPPARTTWYWVGVAHRTIPNYHVFVHRGSLMDFSARPDDSQFGAWCLLPNQ